MEKNYDLHDTLAVQLEDGKIVKFETTSYGKEDVAISARPIQELCDTLEQIANAIYTPIKNCKPTKASVKFGVDIALESGQLTALIVKGNAKANLEITLEWSSNASNE